MLTGSGSVQLPSGVYDLTGSVNVISRSIVGTGVIVHHTPENDRESAAFILKGEIPRVEGVTVIGRRPDGAPYDDKIEAQHAFRVDGADAAMIANCGARNIGGDGIYVGTAGQDAHGAWTRDLLVQGFACDEIGRHAVTLDAAERVHLTGFDIGRVNMAIVDIEPPGHPYGCRSLQWLDSIVRDSGGGFVLSNKGVGSSTTVSDILLDGIRCLRRLFDMTVNPVEPGTRRQRFTVRNCAGAGIACTTPITFRHVDGVTVENIAQQCAPGVPLVETIDCTAVVVPKGSLIR